MHKSIHIADGETHILAGLPVSPSGPPLGPTVVPFPFPCRNVALVGRESEASSFDDPVSIGELAVRIVARWSLPRIHCEMMAPEAWEEEQPPGP